MRRDAGFNLVELLIGTVLLLFVGVYAVLAAAGAVDRSSGVDAGAASCLGELLAHPGGTCPATRKPYQDGACSDPHVEPRTVAVDGRLRQDLPAPLAAELVEGRGTWIRVERREGLLLLEERKNGWSRWLWAPLTGMLAALVVLAGAIGFSLDQGSRAKAGACYAAAAVVGLLVVAYLTRTVEIEIDVPKARVTRSVSAWGVGCGRRTEENVADIAALKSKDGYAALAVGKGGTAATLFQVPPASLGLIARLRSAFDAP